MTTGQRLRQTAKTFGLTQRALAAVFGVSDSTIWALFQDDSFVSPCMIERINAVLNVEFYENP